MKPNLPRSWHSLPQREKDAITRTLTDQYHEQLNHEEAQIQKIWLKMMCIANHDVLKIDKIKSIQVLSRWKRLYHIVSKFKTADERDAYLDGEIAKIFGKDGYPTEWVDSLENGGNKK